MMHAEPDLPSRTAFKIDQSGYNLPSPSTFVLLLRRTKGGGHGEPLVVFLTLVGVLRRYNLVVKAID